MARAKVARRKTKPKFGRKWRSAQRKEAAHARGRIALQANFAKFFRRGGTVRLGKFDPKIVYGALVTSPFYKQRRWFSEAKSAVKNLLRRRGSRARGPIHRFVDNFRGVHRITGKQAQQGERTIASTKKAVKKLFPRFKQPLMGPNRAERLEPFWRAEPLKLGRSGHYVTQPGQLGRGYRKIVKGTAARTDSLKTMAHESRHALLDKRHTPKALRRLKPFMGIEEYDPKMMKNLRKATAGTKKYDPIASVKSLQRKIRSEARKYQCEPAQYGVLGRRVRVAARKLGNRVLGRARQLDSVEHLRWKSKNRLFKASSLGKVLKRLRTERATSYMVGTDLATSERGVRSGPFVKRKRKCTCKAQAPQHYMKWWRRLKWHARRLTGRDQPKLEVEGLPGKVKLQPVKSSTLAAVGYNPSKRRLLVSFRRGGKYGYDKVSRRTHASLLRASSKGRYFARKIRDKYFTERLS